MKPVSLPLTVKSMGITVDLYISIDSSEEWYLESADVHGDSFDWEGTAIKVDGEWVPFEKFHQQTISDAVSDYFRSMGDYKHTTGESYERV